MRILQNTINSIAFVDKAVSSRVPTDETAGSEVVEVDGKECLIKCITDKLKEHSHVNTIRLIGHGSPGSLCIGRNPLTLESLYRKQEDIKQWQSALSDSCAILIYGCNVAEGREGISFIRAFAEISSAGVAASSARIGAGFPNILDQAIGTHSRSLLAGANAWESSNLELGTYTVTSDEDDGSSGTLRWAIDQANSNPDNSVINFSLPSGFDGVITLTSSLPAITENLVINGPGQNNLKIDGGNGFRLFDIRNGDSLTIEDITLTKGATSNGSLVFNSRGTFTANRVSFTDTNGRAFFSDNGTSYSAFNASTFNNNLIGIASDYGSTPSSVQADETQYTNRVYVANSLFTNNTTGISTERFIKVSNSTFSNNNRSVYAGGLNRAIIENNLFDGGSIGISTFNWTPTSWSSVGANNRLINNNTFMNLSYAVYLNDSWNDGQSTQRWTSLTNNSWDGTGLAWIGAQHWDTGSRSNLFVALTSINNDAIGTTVFT